MPADDCPDDEDHSIRQTYNFAPGNHGLVYRADVPDHGAGKHKDQDEHNEEDGATEGVDGSMTKETKYKLQGMKWGLIPFWTKRSPDYGSMMKTINARDDTVANGGMWKTMRQNKRCIVVCEGFYEWQKKNNGRERIPHFIKRKDGQLLCFAGLWDCVKYEGQDEKLYTYTVITTSSNKQLGWLHDRMPVILDNGSEAIKTWLDPGRSEWSKELQMLLKPWDGELELYPVDQAVGKVGNNSPSFIVPVDSKENKKNIANFFGAQKKEAKGETEEKAIEKAEVKVEAANGKVKREDDEDRVTDFKAERTEDNAPIPKPKDEPKEFVAHGIKREVQDDDDDDEDSKQPNPKSQRTNIKQEQAEVKEQLEELPRAKATAKTRSSTRNNTMGKSPSKAGDGSKKITSFFAK